jgi:hypothetical protein
MDEQAFMRDTIPDCEQIVFPGANHDIAYCRTSAAPS